MFFPKFPSTKLQDVNLDWLLKKICKLRGGTRNQVLAKASDADFDFKWITGGGGGGTSDYNDLVNQPQINSVTLVGNKSAADLGLLGAAALASYRTAAAQDAIDATKQAKITASGMLKGDGDGGVTAATPSTDYLAPADLMPYRTAAAQDTIDAAKQAKITASGMLKGDGNGGVSTATEGTDYLGPSALQSYRTAADQDVIDGTQNTQITARAKANEIGIVITGALPAMVVSAGQYVIVRNSTIAGITDGLYTAVNALSPGTNVTAADLIAVSVGGLNDLKNSVDVVPIIITPNSSYVDAIAAITSVKIGRLAVISLTFSVGSEVPNLGVLFTDLPRPLNDWGSLIGQTGTNNMRVKVTGTTLIADGPGPAGWYSGVLTYPTYS